MLRPALLTMLKSNFVTVLRIAGDDALARERRPGGIGADGEGPGRKGAGGTRKGLSASRHREIVYSCRYTRHFDDKL